MRIYERNSKTHTNPKIFVDSDKFVGSNRTRGAVTLPSILLISAIIMEIAIVGVIISSAVVNTANNAKLSSEALKAAGAGIQDAIIRVVRYCSLTDNSGCPSSYPLTVGTRTVNITIDSVSVTPRKITADATAGLVKKRMQAVLNINQSTGEVTTQSIKECPYSSTNPTSC